MQAQVTDLVLQRFQSAELADLPALLRFLLQHVNSQNASQVISFNSTSHVRLCSTALLQTWSLFEGVVLLIAFLVQHLCRW